MNLQQQSFLVCDFIIIIIFFLFLIQIVDLFSGFEGELVLTSHMSQATKSVKILQQALGGLLISPFFFPLHFKGNRLIHLNIMRDMLAIAYVLKSVSPSKICLISSPFFLDLTIKHKVEKYRFLRQSYLICQMRNRSLFHNRKICKCQGGEVFLLWAHPSKQSSATCKR